MIFPPNSDLSRLVAPAVVVGDQVGEGDIEVPGGHELVPSLVNQVDHLGVGQAEQQSHEEALEGGRQGRQDLVALGEIRIFAWSDGKQEKVDAENGDEEESGLGLLHGGAVDPVRGAPPLGLHDTVRRQLRPQHPHHVAEEDNVEGDDQDDGDDQEDVGVFKLRPAELLVYFVGEAVVRNNDEDGRHPA